MTAFRATFVALSAAAALVASAASAQTAAPSSRGVVELVSAHGFDETVRRLKSDVEGKGIRFFAEIDQAALAKDAGIPLRRSTLLVFGNPPLGIQFLTASPYAGLDWPVRMLVFEDATGRVRVAWTDFNEIAARHGVTDRTAQFRTADEVAASIASAAR